MLVLLLGAVDALAQQLPADNRYYLDPFALSPAMAGHNRNVESFFTYRDQWSGVDGAPVTRYFSINGSLGRRMGLGGYVMSDQVGLFRTVIFQAAYSYRLPLSDDQALRFGVSAGLNDQFIDVANQGSNALDVVDPVVSSNQGVNQVILETGFGIDYNFRQWNIGVSASRLVENEVMNEDADDAVIYTQKRQFQPYLTGRIKIKKDWQLQPFLLARVTENDPVNAEGAFLLKYQHQVWLAAHYRTGNTVGVGVGGNIYNRLAINYLYEFSNSGILGQSNGSHEFTLGILIGRKENEPTSIFNAKTASGRRPYLKFLNGLDITF